jgi:hypothetical protein
VYLVRIAQLRLTNLRITGGKCRTPEQVVRSLGAVQAQDYNQSLWAIGLRMHEATFADVESALQEGKIMRTWIMRGTLHLILPEDVGWMLKLLAPRTLAKLTPKVWEYHATDARMMALAEKTFIDALRGGKVIERSVMIDLLASVGISNERQQSYFIFGYLCQTGVLCVGPPQGKEQTFALLDEWAPRQRELTYEESIVELAQRFFTSHGPATVADFANWAGIKAKEARMGLDVVQCGLVRELFAGKEYWLPPDSQPGSGTHLLPAYDELLIGYKDRGPSHEKYGAVPISTYNGMFYATAVEDGQVVALWKRTIKKSRVDIALRPVAPIDAEQVREHAELFGRFLGLPPHLTIQAPAPPKPKAQGFKKKATTPEPVENR